MKNSHAFSPSFHTRRHFLRTSILGGAVAWTLPAFIDKTFAALDGVAAGSATQIATGKDGPILVILQLSGGNDGLNTLIPYADDAYYRARPRLSASARGVLPLSDAVGLNPRLSGLARMCADGEASVIQGVGYPNPNRSHFRSMEIWHTASESEETLPTGWLGRYFDNCCPGADPTVGISIGERAPQAFDAREPQGIALKNPERFKFAESGPESAAGLVGELAAAGQNPTMAGDAQDGGSIGMLDGGLADGGDTFAYIERVALDARVASDRIADVVKKHKGGVEYPRSAIGQELKLVAQLIAGGMPTKVYYAGQGGYDTHAGQSGSHDNLLGQLDEAITAFTADMKAQGNFDRVVLMTFSEFGRRVNENASGGTDHGAAAPMFLIGGGTKPGLFGSAPSLTDLDAGDLKFSTDFRRVYATVLEDWLRAPSDAVLGRKFDKLTLF